MLRFIKHFSLIFFLIFSSTVSSAEKSDKLLTTDWTFKGPFGKFDRASLQRGYQVYQEVCASCHSLKYMSYRNLSEKGGPEFSVKEAKAIAANFEIPDGATDALQTAQNSVLAQTEGAFEELSSFTENEDFKAAFTKAQEKLSSAETQQDITSGLAQAEKDLSSVTGGLLDKVPSDLSVKIPELPNIKGLGSKIPKKLPFDV